MNKILIIIVCVIGVSWGILCNILFPSELEGYEGAFIFLDVALLCTTALLLNKKMEE